MQPLRPLHRRSLLGAALLGGAAWLTGCSTPARSRPDATDPSAAAAYWSGRMALQLQESDVLPSGSPSSFSASFELQGSPQAGSLQLFTPLGSSVARITWSPQGARLEQGSDTRSSTSLDELVRDTLGTAIPIPALFAWLQGQPQNAEGWSVDLSRHAEGRIAATRHHPTPQASLRLILDR